MNCKLKISYDGTNYSGWQIQPSNKTIQGEIECALKNIFKEKIDLIGSGRTDSGVHAYSQVANFHVSININPEQIKQAINANLNNDIFVKSCDIVDDAFHSRFSAIERQYEYNISKNHNPFNRFYKWTLKWENIDCEILEKCSKIILGEYDFGNFCKATSKKDNNVCIINQSQWTFNRNTMKYKIKANRFLHHMVRFLVGTMIEVSRGKISINDFKILMKDKSNTKIRIVSAPAKGLFLKEIRY